ncbi:MAG: ABC transporter permease subunit [Oscillospiraceae bacterium]
MSTKIQNKQHSRLWKEILKNKYIYLILIPGLIYYVIFAYGPMYGLIIAFKDYQIREGILGSPWNGLDNFRRIFKDYEFYIALKNTLVISFSRIIIQFPVPIILALFLNELKEGIYKKTLQTVLTFPNFLSWVVVSSILINLLSNAGAVNSLIALFGFERQNFLADSDLFRPLLYVTEIWKSAGWGSIIYLAAISAISPELYEAATIDGANKIQKMIFITWPSILPTVVVMLILSVGGVMNAGFDQIFNMQNPAVREVSDILDTYIYRITFGTGTDFGFSTGVGLFKSVVNFILLISFDKISRIISGHSNGIF